MKRIVALLFVTWSSPALAGPSTPSDVITLSFQESIPAGSAFHRFEFGQRFCADFIVTELAAALLPTGYGVVSPGRWATKLNIKQYIEHSSGGMIAGDVYLSVIGKDFSHSRTVISGGKKLRTAPISRWDSCSQHRLRRLGGRCRLQYEAAGPHHRILRRDRTSTDPGPRRGDRSVALASHPEARTLTAFSTDVRSASSEHAPP